MEGFAVRRIRKGLTIAVGLAVTAAMSTACGGGDDPAPQAAAPGEKVELTIATFTEFGYENLLPEYESLHPNIKITHRKTGQGGPHHQNLSAKRGVGAGLGDIEAVEEGHLSDILDKSPKFNDLTKIGP